MLNNQPLPPIPTPRDFEPFFALLQMITDAGATKVRLGELATASAAVQALIDQAKQAEMEMKAARKAHDQAISQERAAHNAAIAQERARSQRDCSSRERVLAEREAEIEGLKAKATADAESAAALKLDLEQRLARMAALAA